MLLAVIAAIIALVAAGSAIAMYKSARPDPHMELLVHLLHNIRS